MGSEYEVGEFGLVLKDVVPEHYGPFTGKGGQQAARDAARSDSPLVLFVDRREFYAFDGPDARAAFMEKNKAREIMERISGSKPFRPVLDVDGPPSMSSDDVDSIREAWAAAAVDIGVPADQAAPLCLWAPRSEKLSVHMVANLWQVPDGPAGTAFAKAVQRHSPPRLQRFIDVGASGCSPGASFGMRLPWGLKLSKDRRGRVEGSNLMPESFGWWENRVAPWCLQGEDDGQVYAARTAVAALPETGPMDPAPLNVAAWTTGAGEGAACNSMAKFAARIAAAFPHFVRDARASEGSVMSYTRKGPANCTTCDRVHDSQGAYVTEWDGLLFLNCRNADDGDTALMVHRTRKMPIIEDEFEGVAQADQYASQRYNSEAFAGYVQKFVDGCDLFLRAPWKTGKTVFAGQLIRELGPDARVLIISCRKSLSTALSEQFGAKDYRQIKGDFTDDAISRSPISIWQIDSLKRIPSDVKPFDMILVDEPAALLSHVNQPRAGHLGRIGITRARVLLQKASRIYVSDNDLSTAHVEAFKTIRQGKRSYTLVNTFESWKGVPVEVITGPHGQKTLWFKLFEFLDEQEKHRKEGRPWSGAVVPCHSRKIANGIAHEARERYGSEFVKLYTGETDDETKATDFRDPVEAWKRSAVVAYTSTVSVGVSAETDQITNAFGFFGGGNIGALQSAQMLFRCRRLKALAIHYGGQEVNGLPQTPKRLFKWATLAKNRHVIPDGFRGDCNPILLEPTQEDSKALAGVIMGTFEGRGWVCDTLERFRSANDFVRRIVRTMEAAGCVITMTEPVEEDEEDEEVKEDNEVDKEAKIAESHIDAAASKRDHLAAQEYPNALNRHALDDEDGRAKLKTEEEHQGSRALFAAKVYVDGGGLLFEDLEDIGDHDRAKWMKHHAKPRSLEAYKRLTDIVRGNDRHAGPLMTGDVQTAIHSSAEASLLVRKVVSVLGLDNTMQTGQPTSIPVKELKEPAASLMRVVEEANKHSQRLFGDNHAGRRRKALAEEIKAQTVTATINVVLRFIGMPLKPMYRTERDRRIGNPYAYETALLWNGDKVPEPQPGHPRKRTWYEPADRVDRQGVKNDLEDVLAEM